MKTSLTYQFQTLNYLSLFHPKLEQGPQVTLPLVLQHRGYHWMNQHPVLLPGPRLLLCYTEKMGHIITTTDTEAHPIFQN